MNMTTTSASTAQRHTRRLLVRMNATLFHCLGVAALLEHAAAAYAARTQAADAEQRRQRAQSLVAYAASVWPEFAWEDACAAIRDAIGMKPASAGGAAPASEQLWMFYRALSCVAEDRELCRALRDISSEEKARRAALAGDASTGLLAAIRRVQALRAVADRDRNRAVRRAFDLLQHHWTETPPFPAMRYEAFVSRAYVLLAPHLGLGGLAGLMHRASLACAGCGVTDHAAAGVRNALSALPAAARAAAPAYGLPRTSMVR